MSIDIANFFNRVRNYFIPKNKRNFDINKVINLNSLLPYLIKNKSWFYITEEKEAINFARKHYYLPLFSSSKKICHISFDNISNENQVINLEIKQDINPFFVIENKIRSSGYIELEESHFKQIASDIPRMNILIKNQQDNPIELQSIMDIKKYLGKLPPSHICHICNIANQAHLAEGTIKASKMIRKTQSEFLFQDHGKSSIMINILDNNSYQVISEGYFNLVNTKTGKKVNNSEVIAETTTHFTFDEQDKLIAEKQDKLTLKIKIETNPPQL